MTAVVGDIGGEIRRWRTDTGNSRATDLGPTLDLVTALAWAPDQSCLALMGADGVVQLRRRATGFQAVTPLRPPSLLSGFRSSRGSFPASMTWSPDATRIAIVGIRQKVQVRDVASGHLLATFRGVLKDDGVAAWSPAGAHLAVAGRDGAIRIWEVPCTSGSLRRWFRLLLEEWRSPALVVPAAVTEMQAADLAWSHDGRHLAIGGYNRVLVWDVDRNRRAASLPGEAVALAWSQDNASLAVAGDDGTITVHILDGSTEPPRLHLGSATALAWRGDGIAVVGAGTLTMLRLVTRPE
jgi:WD40 repeat protein